MKDFAFCGRMYIAKDLHFVGEHALQRSLWESMHYKGFCGQTCITKDLHFVGERALQRILWANMHYKGFAFCGRTGIAKEFVGEHALQRICILWDNRNCKGGCVLCKGKVHARIFDVASI